MAAVYEYPDYVQRMWYPFRLKVACSTSLQEQIVKAAKTGFCPHQPCVFEFFATCFDNTDPKVCHRSLCESVQPQDEISLTLGPYTCSRNRRHKSTPFYSVGFSAPFFVSLKIDFCQTKSEIIYFQSILHVITFWF